MKKLIKKIKKIINKLTKNIEEIFYIGQTDKLPPPLTKDEEEFYVTMSTDGDLFSRDKLIEHNLRLVVFLAKKYENTKTSLEDLVSIGTIGLMKAVKTFSLDKNIRLATYASRCIDNEILMYLRKNKRTKTEISLEDNLSYDENGNELHLEDIIGTESNLIEKQLEDSDNKNKILKHIQELNERDKNIIIMRYGLYGTDEKTQKEIAEELGISQSYISRIEKKVIRRLKTAIKV